MAATASTARAERAKRLLREEVGDAAEVLAGPLSALLATRFYARAPALEAEAIVRDGALAWPARRVAALILETLLARIADADVAERRLWLDRLGVPDDAAELAREGYLPGEPMEQQLWRRLVRFGRVHRLVLSARPHERALRDFLRAARGECRLTLGRYLWSAAEVIERIEEDVRRSSGLNDIRHYGRFRAEAARAIEHLPAMERAIAEHLGRGAVVRWVAPWTSLAINSLVEQPVHTVVLTVKPPGSSHEIEIKRAGLPRHLPLTIVWARDNYILPSSHHLDGGAMHQLLVFEAENSAFLSHLFRAVHGDDAAMSRTLYLAIVSTISTPDGEADLIDYFTHPRVFGADFEAMRWNMQQVVRTLAGYQDEPYEEPFNDLALTGDFIGRIKPAQAIQLGTTSFRLDRVERYLSASGPEHYFRRGLRVDHDAEDERRFADEILDEILGHYEPPRVRWRSYTHYVKAAFGVPANRLRANENYLAVHEQLGRFWGTLLGIRGHTQGESFVGRNAGLRSVWKDGRWQIEMSFMDHDSLSFHSIGRDVYRPHESIKNAWKDGKHIFGGSYGKDYRVRGELELLRRIYRAGSSIERRAVAAFRASMKRAYDRTHDAIQTDPEIRRLFRQPFVERLRDWDELVASYLKTPHSRPARKAWKAAHHARLTTRGYSHENAEEHVDTVSRFARFLRRLSFLF
jgi:hypothetical protein